MTPDNRRRIAGADPGPYTPARQEVQTPQAYYTATEAEVWRQAHAAFGLSPHGEPVYFKTPDERAAEAAAPPGSASWVSTQARQVHNAAGETELRITREDHAITCVSRRRTDGPDVVDFSCIITRLRLAMGEGRPSVLQSQAIRIVTIAEGQLTLAVDHQGQWIPQTFTPQARARLQDGIEVAVDHALVDRVRELTEGPKRSNPVLSGDALPIPTRYLRDLDVDIHTSWQDVGDDHGESILAHVATVLQYPLVEREKHRLPRDSVASTAR